MPPGRTQQDRDTRRASTSVLSVSLENGPVAPEKDHILSGGGGAFAMKPNVSASPNPSYMSKSRVIFFVAGIALLYVFTGMHQVQKGIKQPVTFIQRFSGKSAPAVAREDPFESLPFDAAYVIVLPNRAERLFANLGTVGIHPISVPAIHLSQINRTDLVASGIVASNSRLSDGKIAGTLSHRKALEIFVKSGYKTAIIFEDDIAVPDSDVIESMTYIADRLPRNWDMFNMQRCADDCSRQEIVDDNLNLVRCYNPRCANAIAMTRHAAQTILTLKSKPIGDDSYDESLVKLLDDGGTLVAYCAHAPRLFLQDTENVRSEMNPGSSLRVLAPQCSRLLAAGASYSRMKPLD